MHLRAAALDKPSAREASFIDLDYSAAHGTTCPALHIIWNHINFQNFPKCIINVCFIIQRAKEGERSSWPDTARET